MGSKFATPSDLYVDDNKNMNLSCWGIKIRHPLWLLRWQGSLHQLTFLRDQKLAPPLPLTYMWCNIWYMCYVLLYASATSDCDAEQRRGCSEHVLSAVIMCYRSKSFHQIHWLESPPPLKSIRVNNSKSAKLQLLSLWANMICSSLSHCPSLTRLTGMLQDDLAPPRMDAVKLGHIVDVPVQGDPNLGGWLWDEPLGSLSTNFFGDASCKDNTV